jgi:hypothetical protein
MKSLIVAFSLILATPAWGQNAKVVAIADVTVTSAATLVDAASAFRTVLSCTNHTVAVRWGDSTVTATKGQRIPIGATAEIYNRDAVYMISEGANSTVSCTKETR